MIHFNKEDGQMTCSEISKQHIKDCCALSEMLKLLADAVANEDDLILTLTNDYAEQEASIKLMYADSIATLDDALRAMQRQHAIEALIN